jgi:hypothetical protein
MPPAARASTHNATLVPLAGRERGTWVGIAADISAGADSTGRSISAASDRDAAFDGGRLPVVPTAVSLGTAEERFRSAACLGARRSPFTASRNESRPRPAFAAPSRTVVVSSVTRGLMDFWAQALIAVLQRHARRRAPNVLCTTAGWSKRDAASSLSPLVFRVVSRLFVSRYPYYGFTGEYSTTGQAHATDGCFSTTSRTTNCTVRPVGESC